MPRRLNDRFVIAYNTPAVKKVAETKHETQTEYVIKDAGGLRLVCSPTGRATFAVRFTVNGVRRREALGAWGVITLTEARAKALAVAAGVASGVDVLAKEAKEKSRLTLRQLWEERARLDDARADKTMRDYEYALEAHVLPTMGNRPATEITSDEFADLLIGVEDKSKNSARHTKVALSSLYRWGQKRRYVKVNPLAVLGFNHLPKPRKRVLTDAEMKKLWLAIEATKSVTPSMRNILKLAILTGQRNSECAGMECAELKGMETTTPRWDIPGQRMKRKNTDQHVPLSKQAAAIVRDALATSSNGRHVFEGAPKGRRQGKWRQGHIGHESVSRAMAKVVKKAELQDVHLHDMRKCVTSWLAEHNHAEPHVLDAILHHGRKGVTGSHYNFALYEGQVRRRYRFGPTTSKL